MPSWVLARLFQVIWKELYTLSFPNVSVKESKLQPERVLQTA